MGLEIERKFLVNRESWQQAGKQDRTVYRQAYLVHNERVTIRIRTSPTEAFITLKGTLSGRVRKEYEYPLPLEEALEMIGSFAGNPVEKTRYRIPFAGKLWEVDEFSGSNEGLIIAEIELESEQEAFELPPWVAGEVTHDRRYYNAYLSEHPYNSW